MNVFDKLGDYGFIHHRALNDFKELAVAVELSKQHPSVAHILEGDICWNFKDGREDLYFRHPSFVIDSLNSRQIDKGIEKKTLVTIDILEELAELDIFLVVELKVGRGDRNRAVEVLLEKLERLFSGRYWIDGFSLDLMQQVKSLKPDLPVTLHTEFVFGNTAILFTPEKLSMKFMKVSDIKAVDGIAIRWHFWDGYMKRASEKVLATGKILILSRIHNMKQFILSREWNAKAGYVHGDLPKMFHMKF